MRLAVRRKRVSLSTSASMPLFAGVVAITGLNREIFLVNRKDQSGGTRQQRFAWSGVMVAQTILGAKFFGYLVVDSSYGLLLVDFEETSASLLCHAFEDLFSIWTSAVVATSGSSSTTATTPGIATPATGIAATTWVTASPASAGISAPSSAAWEASTSLAPVGMFLALEIDGINDGVGPLRFFDGSDQGFLAPVVDAIGEDDDRLATFLLGHNLVGGEEE